MGKLKFYTMITALYVFFGMIIGAMFLLVASFTIIPMIENYKDHENIFIKEQKK